MLVKLPVVKHYDGIIMGHSFTPNLKTTKWQYNPDT